MAETVLGRPWEGRAAGGLKENELFRIVHAPPEARCRAALLAVRTARTAGTERAPDG